MSLMLSLAQSHFGNVTREPRSHSRVCPTFPICSPLKQSLNRLNEEITKATPD